MVSYIDKKRIGRLGALGGGIVGGVARDGRLAGLLQRRVVNVHGLTEGDLRLLGATAIHNGAGDDEGNRHQDDGADLDDITAMRLQPIDAGGRRFDETILL